MESYQSEEEQVEALKRWWDENGRSIVASVVVVVAGVFGWQSWQSSQAARQEHASDMYQSMLRAVGSERQSDPAGAGESSGTEIANQLKAEFGNTTYAQFAALHLAALAVEDGRLDDAREQLRWVLTKADKGSDTAQVAQLRLARVLAASGDIDQALAILDDSGEGSYGAAYAVVEGDILMGAGRNDEARRAYTQAYAQAAGSGGMINLPSLQQKLQSLSPVPARMPQEAPDVATKDAISQDTTTDEVIPDNAGTPEE